MIEVEGFDFVVHTDSEGGGEYGVGIYEVYPYEVQVVRGFVKVEDDFIGMLALACPGFILWAWLDKEPFFRRVVFPDFNSGVFWPTVLIGGEITGTGKFGVTIVADADLP